MGGAEELRIVRARLRREIAADVIGWCRQWRSGVVSNMYLALELQEMHERVSRELGRAELAERAVRRYERMLARLARKAG